MNAGMTGAIVEFVARHCPGVVIHLGRRSFCDYSKKKLDTRKLTGWMDKKICCYGRIIGFFDHE
uniref:Uncharacterized protein n=1 Tax=Romanomermis culicivorax TaxID=13658 RepID=A0A915I417_ROMCU